MPCRACSIAQCHCQEPRLCFPGWSVGCALQTPLPTAAEAAYPRPAGVHHPCLLPVSGAHGKANDSTFSHLFLLLHKALYQVFCHEHALVLIASMFNPRQPALQPTAAWYRLRLDLLHPHPALKENASRINTLQHVTVRGACFCKCCTAHMEGC